MSISKRNLHRAWVIFTVLLLIAILFLTFIHNLISHENSSNSSNSISSELPLEQIGAEPDSIVPSSIRKVTSEEYISEYDLRVIGFFDPEVWAALDADNRAFILGHTTENESHSYGIIPQIHIDVADLGWSQKNADIRMDDVFLFECDRYAFGWQSDEYSPSITIDRKLLESLDPSEALFVCHKAFYYAYARYLLDLQDQEKLPERYNNCKEQLAQYRADLAKYEAGSTYIYTLLEDDSISFGLSRVEYYYGFGTPIEDSAFYEGQLRRYWRVCLNGIYKKDLLHLLADEMSEYHSTGFTYRIANSEDAKEEYRGQSNHEYTFIEMNDDLLWNGDPLDCVDVLVRAMLPAVSENYYIKYNEELDWQEWEIKTSYLAWKRLTGLIEEHRTRL